MAHIYSKGEVSALLLERQVGPGLWQGFVAHAKGSDLQPKWDGKSLTGF